MPEWLNDAMPQQAELLQLGTNIVRALCILLVGLVAARLTRGVAQRWLDNVLEEERVNLMSNTVGYVIFGLACAQALEQLGFDLSVILGAAGMASAAVAYASQTSIANLVSGVFVILERPFSVGDAISVGGTSGEVTAIDLLSTKIRTFDNLYVRVPNETVMKSSITNFTRYPVRRFGIELTLDWETDAAAVGVLLLAIADRNPHVLAEPAPALNVSGQSPSGITYTWVAWAAKESWFGTRNLLVGEIRAALSEHGIRLAADRISVDGLQPEQLTNVGR